MKAPTQKRPGRSRRPAWLGGGRSRVENELRQRHWLWLHGTCIGLITLSLMWAAAHLQMLLGSDSLALRYLVTLGLGYFGYLLVLRFWAAALLRRESSADFNGDLPLPDGSGHGGWDGFRSGGGGNFGGGGASADFSGAADSADGVGEIAGAALEAAASADEGAVVLVPIAVIFLIGCAVVLGAGSLLMVYFGWEALLAVAVELAFSYATARTAVRVVREGWLSAAVRLTWKPMLGAVTCAVLLGACIDYFVPTANSLPQAIKVIRGQMQRP